MQKYTGKELYEMQVRNNISEYELARQTGLSRSVVHGALYYYKKKHGIRMSASPSEPDTIIKETDGELTIRHTSRIQSLEELIEAFDIDTEKWKVKSFIAEKWDSATNELEKFLIRASFVERKEFTSKPITPIEIVIENEKTAEKTAHRALKRTIALFDLHIGFARNFRSGELIPFHNREALSVALEIATLSQPDTIVFGGDLLDMSEWSDKFILEPGFYFTTQNALLECAWWIGKFKQRCPNAELVMLAGNHEKRLQTLVTKRLIAMAMLAPADDPDVPLTSIDNLLGLSRMGVKYIDEYPDGVFFVAKDTIIEHGSVARARPGMTASAVIDQRNFNVIFGHKHTLEMASKNVESWAGSRVVRAVCGGCLCRLDGTVPGSNRHSQWQNGIVEIVHDNETAYAINPILIENGTAIYNGEMISGSEVTVQQAKKTLRNF